MSLMGFQPGPDTLVSCGGATPCTFGDWLLPGAPCLAFLQCADPSNIVLIGSQAVYNSANAVVGAAGGPVALAVVDPAAGQAMASDIGSAAGAVISATGSAIGAAVPVVGSGLGSGLAAGLGISPTVLYVGMGLAAFLLIKSLVKK